MELGRKKDEEKSNYEIKEDEVFPSKSSAVYIEAAETVTLMDSLLYHAAVNGYKYLPASINHEDEDDVEDDENLPASIADENENEDEENLLASFAGYEDEYEDEDDDEDEVEDEDEDEVEDKENMFLKWRNLKVDEEYYMRKTVYKSNILHLSIQLKHFTFAEKAARRFPRLISDVDADENNSLHVAAQIGDVNFVKILVDVYKEKVKDEPCSPWMEQNKEGNTPLHVALIHGKIELACYFVELDPTLASVCNRSKEAPLHLAIRHRVNDDRNLLRGVMMKLNEERWCYSRAMKCSELAKDSMPVVKLLLEKDQSVAQWRDEKGLTPPLLAASTDTFYVEAIKAMHQLCPESLKECDGFGNTILHLMAKLEDEKDIKSVGDLLRLPSISVLKDRQNNAGDTPAHMAIENNNIQFLVDLIWSSVNLVIKNKKGVSAANLIHRSSPQFHQDMKDKCGETTYIVPSRGAPRYIITAETIREIGFSIEKLKESKMLHAMTDKGNILHTLLAEYPYDMEDDQVRKFIKQVLKMAPQLICQLNSRNETPLHTISSRCPCLIDTNLRQLIKSCFNKVNQNESVERLCDGPPWMAKDSFGNTILHLALSQQWPRKHKSLGSWLKQISGFSWDLSKEKNNKGELPLHLLVKTVCEPDVGTKYFNSILHWMYLGYRVAVNSLDIHGLTPLLLAAQAKKVEIFNSLLQFHRCYDDCNLKTTYDGDPDGNTFWHHIACIQVPLNYSDAGWKNVCSPACEALAKRNKSGKTPFHIAIENGNFKVASMFYNALHKKIQQLPHSIHIDMGDKHGNVPLHLVVGRSNLPYARQFINYVTTSMELIAVQNKKGSTPLHLSVLKQDIEFLNILFDLKRDDTAITRQILLITDMNDNTLLHYAILHGAVSCVDKFFDEGLRAECIDEILDTPNKDGNRPLHLVLLNGDISRVTKIIDRAKEKKSIQPTFDMSNKEGNTSLHLTVLKRNKDIAETLMETAKENNYLKQILGKGNNKGNTPLHLAINNRDFSLVRRLIEYAIEDSCIDEILGKLNDQNESPGSLLGSAEYLPSEFEQFFWNEPVVVQAMLGVRSLSDIPITMIKEYTNTIGVIAALLATITFTAGFTVPGGLNSSNGTPLLMKSHAFKVFMVSDIIAMCLSVMVLFFLMWIMTINHQKHQVLLLDLTVFSLQGAFYATIFAFMMGLYASVFPSTHWIAIFACVLCSLLILLMHKRLIIWFIPGFIHIYMWYKKVKIRCRQVCCLCNKNQNNGEPSGTSSHGNEPTGHSQTVVNIEPNN